MHLKVCAQTDTIKEVQEPDCTDSTPQLHLQYNEHTDVTVTWKNGCIATLLPLTSPNVAFSGMFFLCISLA